MFYFYIIIIILTIIMYYIIKDLYKMLRITSIITISSGYLTLLIGYIATSIVNNKLSFINISKITNIIFNKNLDKALVLLLIGGIELIFFVILDAYKRYVKT